ncbi:MAG: DUF1573 domain-containing protein [Bacteroidaceae bacterium]|nr:DUF1573 domain-containing protein [Bacteroidaceae bacterium]MBP9637706.1 DUF1573 domain-containing protein [Bacteroidaceae bacterium]
MKKFFLCMLALLSLHVATYAQSKDYPEMTFDKTVHDFGKFSEDNPTVSCIFTFTNTGKKALVINQAHASCGCTVPEYTKAPIEPGKKGTVKITYNGYGKYPGAFAKTVTLRTNAKEETVKLIVKGEMTAKK